MSSHTGPLVSVVVPAFNAGSTICTTIDSVLKQSITDLELLVIDDASTDDTVQVVKNFADPRVRIVRLARNGGPAKAHNVGLGSSSGLWFAAVDADDAWMPDRLERLVQAAGNDTCFVTDYLIPAIPGKDQRLVPIHPSDLRYDETPTEVIADYAAYVRLHLSMQPIYPIPYLKRFGLAFPEWGSGGEWAFLAAATLATGLRCKLLRRPGCLCRVTGKHDSSSLRAIEEQLKVNDVLALSPWISTDARRLLARESPVIRKRLLVAALRERRCTKFFLYASRNPQDILSLPVSLARYLARRARYAMLSS